MIPNDPESETKEQIRESLEGYLIRAASRHGSDFAHDCIISFCDQCTEESVFRLRDLIDTTLNFRNNSGTNIMSDSLDLDMEAKLESLTPDQRHHFETGLIHSFGCCLEISRGCFNWLWHVESASSVLIKPYRTLDQIWKMAESMAQMAEPNPQSAIPNPQSK